MKRLNYISSHCPRGTWFPAEELTLVSFLQCLCSVTDISMVSERFIKRTLLPWVSALWLVTDRAGRSYTQQLTVPVPQSVFYVQTVHEWVSSDSLLVQKSEPSIFVSSRPYSESDARLCGGACAPSPQRATLHFCFLSDSQPSITGSFRQAEEQRMVILTWLNKK